MPRAVMVDLEPGILEDIMSGNSSKLFELENFIFSHSGSSNNWAKGFYSEGANIIDQILDGIRTQVEDCDCLGGFQFTQSLGGGTGGGLGSLILSNLDDEYPKLQSQNFTVLPSPKVSSNILETYNALFSFNYLIEGNILCFPLDNEALYNICSQRLELPIPTYGDLNHLISIAMNNTTCCLRFPGIQNSSLRKLATNLVLFPRLHFIQTSCAPLNSRTASNYHTHKVIELIQQLYDPMQMMCSSDPRHGRYLSGFMLFRGRLSMYELNEQTLQLQNKNSSYFIEWIPNNLGISHCNTPQQGISSSANFLGNTTSIQESLKRISESFYALFRRKAYLHWFTKEGMEEGQFTEMESNFNDLISEYQQYQDVTCESEYEFSEELEY